MVYAWRSMPRSHPFADIPRQQVLKAEFTLSIEEIGVIKASKSQNIYSPFSGKITKLLDDGTTVSKGQTVIWMDTEEVEKNLEEQITNLKTTKSDLERTIEQLLKGLRNNNLKVESAAAELEFARLKLLEVNRKLETVQLLVDQNILAKTEVDEAEQEMEAEKFQALNKDLSFRKDIKDKQADESSREAELGKVKLRSMKAKRKIEEARDKITQAEVTAPADGVFLLMEGWDWQKNAFTKPQAGDHVWRRRVLGEIPDLSSLIILCQVSEEDVSKISKGQVARVTTDAFADLNLKATVSRIGKTAIGRNRSPAGSLAQNGEDTGQKVFELDLDLDEKDPLLRPGMTANVSIILEKVPDALTLPFSAIFRKEGRAIVYLATPKGYQTRFVTLGRRNQERVEILSGLKEEDEVFNKDLEEALSQ